MFCRKIRIENSKHDQGKTHNKSWRILWYVDSRDDRQQPQWDSTFPRHDWLKYLFHRWPLELPSFWNIICMRICLKSWDVIGSCGGGKFHLKRLAIARYMFTIYSHSKIWYHNFCTAVWNPAAKYVGSGASVFLAIRTFLSKPIMFANRIAKANRALFSVHVYSNFPRGLHWRSTKYPHCMASVFNVLFTAATINCFSDG